MRALVSIFVGFLALAPMSVQQGSITFGVTQVGLDPAPGVELVELVAQTCGNGWRRSHWRDNEDRWHWGTCVSLGTD
jgi:hypothetical protein